MGGIAHRAVIALTVTAALMATACTPQDEVPRNSEVTRAGVYSNPVIAGFAPDPSIVRVGNDFYLVTSTFEYFPGVPVYHSNDLVNWELIAYALHDPAQVDLDTIDSSGGIHASTIRYHEGTFYLITTNVRDGEPVNFIVTAPDPHGPWSAPHELADAPGIDPSLLFDDDGRVWYVGNHIPPDPEFPGQAEIWLQQLDVGEMRLVGERHYLWRGCCGGVWAEGPHIYRKDGYYYLLISEGGTAHEHAVSVAISKDITGPYQNNPRNPVLTHRHLGYGHPITGVGHADLVELQDGRWYAVALGWRLIDGRHGILGRETFLVPVTWETEPHEWKQERLTFPVFSPASGRVELNFPAPFPHTVQRPPADFVDQFDSETLAMEWNFRRTPGQTFHSLADNPGSLRLFLQPGRISPRAQYSFVGLRQRHFRFEAVTRMEFSPAGLREEAGLVVIMNDRSAFLMTVSQRANGGAVALTQTQSGEQVQIAMQEFAGDGIYLKVIGDYLKYGFYYSADGNNWQLLMQDIDGTALSPATLGGFNYTGVYIGLYATSNGAPTSNHADFASFEYRWTGTDRDDWYRRQKKHAAVR